MGHVTIGIRVVVPHPGRAARYGNLRASVSFVKFLLLFFSFQFYDFRLQLLQRVSLMCRSRHNNQTIRLVTAETAILQTEIQHVDIHNHWPRQELTKEMVTAVRDPRRLSVGVSSSTLSSPPRALGHWNNNIAFYQGGWLRNIPSPELSSSR